LILGVVLSVILAGANAYLGLLAGMTVSASIPAAVISMAVLRLFRNSNICENNIVQTAASAGESLAAGVIFTFPALIMLGAWTEFDYWQTTIIAGLGGVIGVLFTIPLRRALVVKSPLKFPEGVATAEVLKVGDQGGAGIKSIVAGGIIGAIFKLFESGLGLVVGAFEWGTRVGSSIAYFGSNLLPSLVGVGYIVGLNIAVLVFLGGALNWFVAIPILAAGSDWPMVPSADDPTVLEAMPATEFAGSLWSTQTRYLGVGAMAVGGVWALIRMWRSLVQGITSSLDAYRGQGLGEQAVLRTERDAPMKWVGIGLLLAVVPLYFVFFMVTESVGISAFMAVVMLVAGFLFSAVASYMAGLVGSSNNPISGVTIATILTASILLFLLTGAGAGAETAGEVIDGVTQQARKIGPAAAILIGAVVCCAAAIGGDNMQDLKAGQLIGATPRKQQVMQLVGVVAAAFVMAPILSLLLNAYGIVEPASPDRAALAAPQATLMASVAQGVFEQNLPWTIVGIGAALAAVIIVIDLVLEARESSFRMPVLAVAVGIYLPLELATPIFIGGLIAWLAGRARRARGIGESAARSGLLFAAGLITGEALVGILLAIPIVANRGNNPIDVNAAFERMAETAPEQWRPIADLVPATWPGIVLLLVVITALYRIAAGRRES
jgi:putative OPT family oligopeptide transporter